MKTIFITGCSSGIGLLTAEVLHKRGYKVLAGCRKQEDVEKMNQAGFIGILIDMDDEQSVIEAAKVVIDACDNQLYALFNNAGFGLYGELNSISRAQLEKQFATNFFGVHQLTQLLLPTMLPHNEGRIILTSSVLGIVATAKRGAYAASKYALEAWADALRMELYQTNIKVVLIEPGPIETNFTSNVQQIDPNNPVKNPSSAKRFALTPDAVVVKVIDALESPKPKIRYPVTMVAWTLTILKRILPASWLDKLLTSQKG